jgi:hypothetical protein
MICKRCGVREVVRVPDPNGELKIYYSDDHHTESFRLPDDIDIAIALREKNKYGTLPAKFHPSFAGRGLIHSHKGWCYFCEKVETGLIKSIP